MRTISLTAILILSIAGESFAQLSFLGTDKLFKGSNPYYAPELAGGIVTLGTDFYFTTPAGRLYRTDGTEAGTTAVIALKGQSMPILAATGTYLYVGVQDPGYASFLHRYTPGSRKLDVLRQENPAQNFRFNNQRPPGYNLMADLLAVSPDRKYIAFRNFINDAISVNVISDDAPETIRTVKYCSGSEIASLDLAIHPSSEIAFVRNEIFVNGSERDLLTAASKADAAGNLKLTRSGNRAFSASSVIKKPGDATGWLLGSYYHLDSKGYTLYKGLLQTKAELFALVSKNGGETVGEHQLVRFDSTKLLLSKDKLPGGKYYTAEVHDDAIYLLTTGAIYRYDRPADHFTKVFSDTGSGWNTVYDTDLMLKSGKHLLTRVRERLVMIDESTGKATTFSPGNIQEEPNRFSFGDRYAWATRRAFYVMDNSGGKPVFTQVSPDTKRTKAIPMPLIDRSEFVKFRAVFQLGDRFLLLTEYRNRKGDPVFNMFMYREEAS